MMHLGASQSVASGAGHAVVSPAGAIATVGGAQAVQASASLSVPQGPRFARRDWVTASRFLPLSDREVLAQVLQQITTVERPVVVLDLDSTLYQVEPRNYQILQEWVNENREGQFAAYAQALSVLRPDQVGYTVQDNFTAVGINGSQGFHRVAMESLKQFWGKRFFSNEYLPFDRPYAGAPEFVQKLHSLGVQIIYLTGRDDSRMRAGTELNFIRDGFPWGSPSTYLWTKPVYNTPDLAHKRAAAERAKDLGTVVASFENEPANLVALKQILPEAMHVFVDTICSDAVASPAEGVFRIQAF